MLNLAKPVEFSAEPDTCTSVLSFPFGVHSFLKRAKMVLVWLAFPIDGPQSATQKPIESAPAYPTQCTLPPHPPDPPFRFFKGLVLKLIFAYLNRHFHALVVLADLDLDWKMITESENKL